jgi:hypothetical protein
MGAQRLYYDGRTPFEVVGMESTMQRWHREIIVALLLAVAVFVAYGSVVENGFVTYDDPQYFTFVSPVNEGLSLEHMAWAFTTFQAFNWHPLTWLSLQLDASIYDGHPGGIHLTSLIFHLANTLLLFAVLRIMTGMIGRSAAVAACFAVHPLHVESVAWVSERKDVLCGFFGLLTFIGYAWYVLAPGWRRYWAVLLPFALGLMAKPMLVTWPFVLLLLDWWPLQRFATVAVPVQSKSAKKSLPPPVTRSISWLVIEKLPLLLLSVASCLVTIKAQADAVQSFESHPLSLRVANATVAYVRYLGKAAWPVDLAVFYPYPSNGLPTWKVAACATLLVAVTVLVIRQARRRPYLAVGWFWYLGTLVPVIGVMQVGFQAMADRYAYLPLIGIWIMVVWGGADFLAARRMSLALPVGAGVVVLLIWIVLSQRQVGLWRDSVTLWQHALAATHDNAVTRTNLGNAYFAQGNTADCIRECERAIALKPDYADAHSNLGIALLRLARVPAAVEEMSLAVHHAPWLARYHFNLAVALLAAKRFDDAMESFGKALQLNPDEARGVNAGVDMLRDGQIDEARRFFQEAMAEFPAEASK